MAKATEAQIKALEKAHKQALVNILQAIAFRYLMYQKLGANSAEWKKYAQLVYDLSKKWYARQMKLEKGGATKEGILQDDFFTTAGNKKLKALVKKWDSKGEGIGFIPLIIWAITAIAGFFTAEEIVDELNTTAEEQQDLIKTSEEICKKYNFNAEQCKSFLAQQTTTLENNSGGDGLFSGIMPKLLLAGGLYLLFTNKDKIFK